MKNRIQANRGSALAVCLLFMGGLAYGQGAATDKSPDWSGAWSMVGGTVFDRATQTLTFAEKAETAREFGATFNFQARGYALL